MGLIKKIFCHTMRLSALSLFETLPMEKPGFFPNADNLNKELKEEERLAQISSLMMQIFKYQIHDHLPHAVAPPLVATQGNRAEEEE